MEYALIPTNLLIGDYSDAEILAIVKYQMLFSSLEIEPTNKILNKFLTKKQQNLVKNYVADIKTWVQKDIETVNKKRERNARYYQKQKNTGIEQEKIKTSDKTTDGLPNKLINKINKEIEETKIDYFTNPIIEKVFSIYREHCTNLVNLDKFCRKNVELKKQIGLYLEQTESDLEYFARVCDIANNIKKIGSVNIDLKMILKNHDGFYNGKYQPIEEIDDYTTHDDSDWLIELEKKSKRELGIEG